MKLTNMFLMSILFILGLGIGFFSARVSEDLVNNNKHFINKIAVRCVVVGDTVFIKVVKKSHPSTGEVYYEYILSYWIDGGASEGHAFGALNDVGRIYPTEVYH